MDIASIGKVVETGAVLELKGPDMQTPVTQDVLDEAGNPVMEKDPRGNEVKKQKPVTITIASANSDLWQKMQEKIADEVRDMTKKYNALDRRFDVCQLLASVTIAWDGILVDGKKPECTFDNARNLYMKYKWVRDQVEVFASTHKNFMLPTSTN